MRITKIKAIELANYFNLNLSIIPLDEWIDGLNIELEHGEKLSKLTNITNNNLKKTAKIVIAHLIEDPRYYKYLIQMEIKREQYWKNKKKPCIFNNK